MGMNEVELPNDTEVDEAEIDKRDVESPQTEFTEPGPTDDLASLDNIHSQAAANRRAAGPAAEDPSIVTAGESATVPPPGPGPAESPTAEQLAAMDVATPLLNSAGAPLNPETGEEVEVDEEGEYVDEYDDEGEEFDPGAHTVAEVNEYITANPDQADAVIAAEQAGKNRAGIVG